MQEKIPEKGIVIKDENKETTESPVETTRSLPLTPKSSERSEKDILNEFEKSNKRSNRMQTYNRDNCVEKFLVFLSYVIVVIFFPISIFIVFVICRQFERVVILRNGKIFKNRVFGPGLICYLPCVDSLKYIDLRIIAYDVPPQEALTKDSLTVTVDAVVFYNIVEPVWAVINVADVRKSTQYLAATTLRNALGTRKLTELLINRSDVSDQVFHLMKHTTREWGVHVVRVDIKNIWLPLQLQKAMAAEAESTRHANAKIIVARSEIEATKSLQKATAMLMDNPMCMQLRYLQSLHMMAGERTHTVVFPFSAETLRTILK